MKGKNGTGKEYKQTDGEELLLSKKIGGAKMKNEVKEEMMKTIR